MTLLLLATLAAMAGVPKASSELKNDKGKMPVDLAFDGLLSTAWAEADKGPGEGQWVEIDLGKVMDLSPRGIRTQLDLNKPVYARTSAYGHFGRTPDAEGGFSWERTDLADKIKAAV